MHDLRMVRLALAMVDRTGEKLLKVVYDLRRDERKRAMRGEIMMCVVLASLATGSRVAVVSVLH